MPTDVLERVRSEIKDRLAALSGAVSEAQQLEIALVALEDVPVDSRPAPDAGNGRRRHKGARRLHGRKGRRRKGSTPGANDQTVLDSLQGLTEPVDIKAVAGKTGLSQQTASYALKTLAGKGLLTQSSVAGRRGRPKLVFALASNGQWSGRASSQPQAIAPAGPYTPDRRATVGALQCAFVVNGGSGLYNLSASSGVRLAARLRSSDVPRPRNDERCTQSEALDRGTCRVVPRACERRVRVQDHSVLW